MSASRTHAKNPERVASGLKATIHNPNVSAGAKARARERLEDLGIDAEVPRSAQRATDTDIFEEDINDDNMELPSKNTKTTTGGKEPKVMEVEEEEEDDMVVSGSSSSDLEDLDDLSPPPSSTSRQKESSSGGDHSEHRMLGGYKATLHNPRVGKEAKDHAKRVLEEHGVL